MKDRVERAVAALPPDERQQWLETWEGYRHGCGCTEGMIGLVLGVAVIASSAWIGATWLPPGLWGITPWALGAALAGAILGKALGMARARLIALRQLSTLEQKIFRDSS